MKTTLTIPALALFAMAINAQPPALPSGPPQVAEPRQSYNQVKGNLLRMAEKMPAESYDFKPVAEIRSFGELMAHIADSQMRTCSMVNGQQKSADAASKKTKDEIVAALNAAFAECDSAWDGTNEGNAFTLMTAGRGQRSRVGILTGNTVVHNNEEYGYGAIYLRLKGIVPPSSDRGMAAPKK
jgi:uncharacterized damage-inducible protein DinB